MTCKIKCHYPVAVGGVGGSGTRLIAQILMELGYYIGSDLNRANDNLWFTFLFRRKDALSITDTCFEEILAIFVEAMERKTGFTESQIKLINNIDEGFPVNWLKDRAESLLSTRHKATEEIAWGWKAPNTHIFVDRLFEMLPKMKYIHVIRNGLDVAYSKNQNQLRLWGKEFLPQGYQVTPYYSLKFWCQVHRRILDIGKQYDSRFLMLNFDQLCLNPKQGINNLLDFLEVNSEHLPIEKLLDLVKAPESIGRYKQLGLGEFDVQDIAFVQQLGFDIDPQR